LVIRHNSWLPNHKGIASLPSPCSLSIVLHNTTFTPTQGRVHSERPMACLSQCVPIPTSVGSDDGKDVVVNFGCSPSNKAEADSFRACDRPATVLLAISTRNAPMSELLFVCSARAVAGVVYSRGMNHDAIEDVSSPCWRRSMKQRLDHWQELANRITRSNEQYMHGRLRK